MGFARGRCWILLSWAVRRLYGTEGISGEPPDDVELGFPRFLGGMLLDERELCQRHEEGSIRSSALAR